MSRDKIYTLLHKLRACIVRQTKTGCDHDCENCPYQADTDEIVEMLDVIIELYSYVIQKKKKPKRRFWRKGA